MTTSHSTKTLCNFRLNKFYLFSTMVEVVGMAGPHNNSHLGNSIKTRALRTMQALKNDNRCVYINLHEAMDFKPEAKKVGIEYHWLRTEDFAKTPIPTSTFDEIYKIVKKAFSENKQVFISCGAGDGRTGAALASLKLRELIEQEFRHNPLIKTRAKVTTFIRTKKSFIPCTPLVKKAVELIRTRDCVTFPRSTNGSSSVETENDIRSLMNYEEHLRKKISNNSTINFKLFARDVFGPYLFAGSNPIAMGHKGHTVNNLHKLKKEGITTIYSLEGQGKEELTTYWSMYGVSYRHITERRELSYLVEDFRAPNLKQIDQITNSLLSSIENQEKIYLHCNAGQGRTGIILAALYMKKTGALPKNAIAFVKAHYSIYAIETEEQIEALKEYYQFLHFSLESDIQRLLTEIQEDSFSDDLPTFDRPSEHSVLAQLMDANTTLKLFKSYGTKRERNKNDLQAPTNKLTSIMLTSCSK